MWNFEVIVFISSLTYRDHHYCTFNGNCELSKLFLTSQCETLWRNCFNVSFSSCLSCLSIYYIRILIWYNFGLLPVCKQWNLIWVFVKLCSKWNQTDHRSSCSQMFFKISVLKNLANFTRKRLWWSRLFLINLQAWSPATLLKETLTQVFSREICENF